MKREVFMVKKFILVFKTHFDIGFTDLSSKIIDNYSDSMLKEVIATCKATEHMGKLKYVWTMPAWPLKVITERCSGDLKKELDLLIERGQIVWHALPFTSHTDFCSAGEYIEGLRFGRELSEVYHKPYKLSAKMTDVPGHGIMLPDILSGAGVKFLHLGCNEFASPPKVPFLFYWVAKSGKRLLTMYSKGGYGTSLLPPKDWNYPVWMALMQTHDNCGPQSAAVIEKLVKQIQSKYPEAEIVCGSMDDFYNDLAKCDLSYVPTITKDLGDTWIHGIGSYPKEVGIIREERERSKRLQAMYVKQLLEVSSHSDDRAEEILNRYYENVSLFEEHTWGADVKTWLGPDRVYPKADFLEAKHQDNYQFMENSWQEQRDRAEKGSQAMEELKILVEGGERKGFSIFNPYSGAFTGWVSVKGIEKDFAECSLEMNQEILPMTQIDGEWSCYVKELPPLLTTPLTIVNIPTNMENLTVKNDGRSISAENHRYVLRFSEVSGEITELYDKKLEAVLLKQQNQKSVFSYQYDRYGMEEVTTFLKDYAYRFSAWGIQDYGREAYPECGHKTYYPSFKSFVIEGDTLIFCYENTESKDRYGDADKVIIEITLPPAGDELFVNLKLINKQETPYIESGSFLIPFAERAHYYRVNKANAVLNPETEIQEGANHVLYCLENYISAAGDKHGICVIPKDTPLVSLGDTGIYKYRNAYKPPKEPVIYFNLFNNMWGTNFPQWTGGDLCSRYVLFGFNREEEAKNLEIAARLKESAELTENSLTEEICRFPEHMQLINARKVKKGIIVRFKDLRGEESLRKLVIGDYSITPVDLNNMAEGESAQGETTFKVRPYGIYSFLLSKGAESK
ncbi:MAG: DUF5054 domain-containing protein [Anaerocolumna sp.]